jgi:adenylyltransferase/sulfurtransferase
MGAPLSWTRLRAALRESAVDQRFVVIGAGGLGCPALLGLVGAGARHITLVDHDHVDASNLPRQVLFGPADVGVAKVDAAAWSLHGRVPERSTLQVETIRRRLDDDALADLLDRVDLEAIVLECSDSPRLKFAVHDACLARDLRVVIGGVVRWHGQAMAIDPSRPDTACYRCLFEAPPPPELTPACEVVGVSGPAAGTVGHAMALLALGLAGPHDRSPAGVCLHFDLLSGGVSRLAPKPRRDCATCARNHH